MIIDQFFISKKNYKNSSALLKGSESPVRSLVKAISWRFVGTLDTIIISWFITGKVSMALTIGSIELITKMVLFFFHERIWNVIKWKKR